MTETIERYLGAWHEQTPETVKAALTQCCAENITYTDKNTPLITGIDEFVGLVMSSHEKVPGRTFSLLTSPVYFNQTCYYSWGINIPGKGEFVGHDFVEYDEQNLIQRIVGFVPA